MSRAPRADLDDDAFELMLGRAWLTGVVTHHERDSLELLRMVEPQAATEALAELVRGAGA